MKLKTVQLIQRRSSISWDTIPPPKLRAPRRGIYCIIAMFISSEMASFAASVFSALSGKTSF